MPFYLDSFASEKHPILAISIKLDLTLLANLYLSLEPEIKTKPDAPKIIMATKLTANLANATNRLLEVLHSKTESKILAPGIIREIYFRILQGNQANSLTAVLNQESQFAKISQVLNYIHQHFETTFSIEKLAEIAGMSSPSFYNHFKKITQTSPVQYIKSVRLYRARFLLIRNKLTANEASYKVGYNSPTQFNREFKRFFGRTPVEETKLMTAGYALHSTA